MLMFNLVPLHQLLQAADVKHFPFTSVCPCDTDSGSSRLLWEVMTTNIVALRGCDLRLVFQLY